MSQMRQMGMGRIDPRDIYDLLVQPDVGPSFRAPIDVARVELEGDGHPRDPQSARMREINRQIVEYARAQMPPIDLSSVHLQKYQEQFKHSLRSMGRIARVQGLVYRVGGRIPDPRDVERAAQIRALKEAEEKLIAQRKALDIQIDVATTTAEKEAERLKAENKRLLEVINRLASTPRSAPAAAPQSLAQDQALLRQAEQRVREAEEALQAAESRAGQLETQIGQLRMQNAMSSDQGDELARLKIQIKNQRSELKRYQELISKGQDSATSMTHTQGDTSPGSGGSSGSSSGEQTYGVMPDDGL